MSSSTKITNLESLADCGINKEFEVREVERLNEFTKLAENNNIKLKIGKQNGYDSIRKMETNDFAVLFDENAKKAFIFLGVHEDSFPDLERNLIDTNILLSTDYGNFSIEIMGGHYNGELDNWMSLSSLHKVS